MPEKKNPSLKDPELYEEAPRGGRLKAESGPRSPTRPPRRAAPKWAARAARPATTRTGPLPAQGQGQGNRPQGVLGKKKSELISALRNP